MRKIGLILGGILLALLALAGAHALYVGFASNLAAARQALLAGETELALDHLAAATVSPFLLPHQKAEAFKMRGMMHYRAYEDENAAADFSAAIKMSPDGISYRFRSFVHERNGRYDEALSDLTELLTLVPSDVPARLGRASLHESLLNHEGAIEDYDAVMELQPDFRSYLLPKRAMAHAERGMTDKAIEDALAIPLKDSYDYMGHLERGIALDNVAAHDLAQQEFEKAIRLKPRMAEIHHARGVSRVAAGEFNEALHDFDTAIDLDPEQRSAFNGRGRANYHLRRLDAARRDLEQSLAFETGYVYPALWLHLVHLRSGKPQPAVLRSHAEKFSDDWPRPILDFFAGLIDREALFEKAAEGTPSVQREQLCEVQFFLGAAQAARGDRRGKAALEAAREICPRAFIEYSAALHELKSLAAGRR
ncbi:MAG: tetratricopeptide repeat protein [Parvibaculaceae bacterium]|nr:tetratricopeptide repeat protein [Parvibaculaceae bacterium]